MGKFSRMSWTRWPCAIGIKDGQVFKENGGWVGREGRLLQANPDLQLCKVFSEWGRGSRLVAAQQPPCGCLWRGFVMATSTRCDLGRQTLRRHPYPELLLIRMMTPSYAEIVCGTRDFASHFFSLPALYASSIFIFLPWMFSFLYI